MFEAAVSADFSPLTGWTLNLFCLVAGGVLFGLAGRLLRREKNVERSLQKAVLEASTGVGDTFFKSFIQHLAALLKVEFAFIGELFSHGGVDRIRTIAAFVEEKPADDFEYALADTPCAKVMAGEMCCYPRGVQDEFPRDRLLAEMGVESYLGTPLRDSSGRILGLIVVMGRRPLRKTRFVEAALRLFAARASSEMERRHRDDQLRKLSRAIEQCHSTIVVTDRTGNIEYVNPRFTEVCGYRKEEVLGKNPRLFKSGLVPDAVYRELWQTITAGRDWRGEIPNRKKNGELFWEAVVISPVKNAPGDITHFLKISEDVTARKEAEKKISYLSQFDKLTNLPNQVQLHDRLVLTIAQAERRDEVFAVLCLDIDHFKKINATWGHRGGDLFLQRVAERVSRCLRTEDTLARFGSDCFILVLPNVQNDRNADKVARKVMDTLKHPLEMEGEEVFVTASIGITLFPCDAQDPSSLLRNAETALHRAKERGRNNIQFYQPAMNSRIRDNLLLENQLRRGLEREELDLFYQPQVASASRKVLGVEALVRWRHPQRGLLLPGQFLSLAEEGEFARRLNEWVLRKALRQASQWRQQGIEIGRLSVNISARQFQDPALVRKVEAALTETKTDPSRLCLEITENTLMSDMDQAASTLLHLKTLGIQVAVDDFGTGYSSLSYLKHLPVDILKIDRSFIADIDTSKEDRAIVVAIIAMAQKLRLKILAEGVETLEQYVFLAVHGSQEQQGFFFSPPLPAAEFVEFVGRFERRG